MNAPREPLEIYAVICPDGHVHGAWAERAYAERVAAATSKSTGKTHTYVRYVVPSEPQVKP